MEFLREDKFDVSSSSSSSSCSWLEVSSLSREPKLLLASERPKKRAGRRVFKETRHPVYRGVRRRNKDKWVCEVRVPNGNTRIWLGTYSTVEMAARAHDVAALALRGKSACLNFADSAWRLPLPESTNAAEIRRVAALAAEEFGRSGDDFEVCSLSSTTAEEEVIGDAPNVQDYCEEDEATYIYQNPAVSTKFDELRHLIVSMAEEPLRSPPSVRPYGWSWDDVEADTEVSLWQY
ncbi:dehydration-responsive element-binding protein 1E-like [Neltuma alba]|uniref:dehydration-responsive element-binding protein 1E-like n=1 Tax=Neltuma alba TaxID=207710 RepID=UPI0010A442C9|nr:dehydration-responsive element-binding protein 1E-like [Prosopis alba]